LIGVRKEDATDYLWSWHVWLTGYNPDDAPPAWQEDGYSYGVPGGHVHRYSGETWAINYTDKVIMDRNLGAASALREDGVIKTRGLYYQFGRKEPFPATSVKLYNVSGATVTTFTASTNDCIVRIPGRATIKTAVQYPYNFYYQSTGGDWVQSNPYLSSSWNNPIWHSSPTGKSFFDPCPPGWRLPVDGVWNAFGLPGMVPNAANYPSDYKSGQNHAGWEFYISGSSGETTFYPAAGMRHSVTGTMINDLTIGYLWTATSSNGINSRALNFNESSTTQPNFERSRGYPVRCIQE
ncbi:MAG: fibrobacter succinogenes major paralogous domain-containing protein, partial [Odoribacteraceae bacterium]|jgi:uncharacterized protein (TIGR02145 family)|nr:fibrobacter succinogenes major paralogous domain-containing protein [Odoribacteraceae bacterium]